MISQKTSTDLFNKIRSKFGNITIGDDTGSATADPSKAVFFDFEYTDKDDEFGRISISLADGESMKVFYNRDLTSKIDEMEKGAWYSFIKELKDFAVEHQSPAITTSTYAVRTVADSSGDRADVGNGTHVFTLITGELA